MKASVIRSLALACALTLSLGLAACGGGDENNSTENNSTENNSTENNSTENNSTENNSSGMTNPFEGDETAISNGQARFETNCVSCHNVDGSAGPVSMKPLSDSATNLDDATLYSKISDGVEGTSMVGYSSMFSEDEIWELVSFIRTLDD